MPLKGNKGEWSEAYTLLKLLGDGEVYAGDESLNKVDDLVFPIVMILRLERDGLLKYVNSARDIIVQRDDGTEVLRLPANVFQEEARKLLGCIGQGRGAFAVPQAEEFLRKIQCSSLTAKSSNKTDIRIVLYDIKTGTNSEMGFSIKSQLGNNATLLNASGATNISYKIDGAELSETEISGINSIRAKDKIQKRFEAIKLSGRKLVFDRLDDDTFFNNLRMLDDCLPQIVASLLLTRIEHRENDLKKLLEIISEDNPLGFDSKRAPSSYAYKVKHLLVAFALGMMPHSEWDGKFDANGGYLVVRKDGEILCYRFSDRNKFEDYLLANTYLESASSGRHKYGEIVLSEDGKLIFKLNLQIRFKGPR